MLRHLIKMLWNRRRAAGLLFLEILLAFVVLFGVYGFLSFNVDRYSSPLGFESENRVGVRLDFDDELDSLTIIEAQARIRRDLLELPEVEAASWIGPVNPFGGSTWSSGIVWNDMEVRTQLMFVDEYFPEALDVHLIEGRWFTEDDYDDKYPPMVVNLAFKEKYFPGDANVIDSTFAFFNDGNRVVGVTNDFKYKSNFAENVPLSFLPQLTRMSGDDKSPFEMMIIHLRPGTLAEVEETIYNQLAKATKNPDVVIWDMGLDRVKANRSIVIPLVILLVVSGFLIINIALGLFGVLFTQISRRRAEIGLRKAMGATPGEITGQFVAEMLLITGAALLVGVFFAIQIPLLELLPIPAKFLYLGIVGAILTILLIVTLCALLPSLQAARLQPATVLHED